MCFFFVVHYKHWIIFAKVKDKNSPAQWINIFGFYEILHISLKILSQCQSSISSITVVFHKKCKKKIKLKSYILEEHQNVWKHY